MINRKYKNLLGTMKTKGIIVASVALTIGIGAIYFWLDRRESTKKINNKPEEPEITKNEQPGWKPKTPEALLRGLIQEILKENVWKNERDFLSTLTKFYIKEAPEIKWVDYLPMNQEDLLEKMNEFGCLTDYEGELERRYRK
jgi:hypothetical protein